MGNLKDVFNLCLERGGTNWDGNLEENFLVVCLFRKTNLKGRK